MNLPILTVMVIVYLAIMTNLVYLGYRQTKTSDDYLIAGRDIHPWVMALSYGATFISTSAIVGFGGVAGFFGFSLLWLTFLNIVLGILVAFAVFGVRIRKMAKNLGSNTFAGFLGQRYGSDKLRIFSGIMIFILMPAYTSAILVGGARFLEESLMMDYNVALLVLSLIVGIYVITGGLRAVMYSDAFAACIMLAGMVVLLIGGYRAVGGVITGHSALTDLAHLVTDGMAAAGHRGWTAMPAFGSPFWWTVVSTIVLGVGVGVLAQPQLAMRFMTVKKTKSLYRAIFIGSIFIFFMTGTAFMIGPLSNLYFYETEGMTAVEVAGGNFDLIIPIFINRIMPTWFLYLFMLTLLSAAISTVSSLIHVQGTAFGVDVAETLGLKLRANGDNSTFMARLGVIIGLLAAISLAYILPPSIIARATAFWFGICAVGFLPALVGALFWKRASMVGALSSVVTGFAVAVFGFAFLHEAEAKPLGLVNALLGRDTLLEFPWTHIDPLIYALPISAIVYVLVSRATKPVDKAIVDNCFDGIKTKESQVETKIEA